MPDPLVSFFKFIASDKGRDANRLLIFLLALYTAWAVGDLRSRVAVLETLERVTRQAVTSPGQVTPASSLRVHHQPNRQPYGHKEKE